MGIHNPPQGAKHIIQKFLKIVELLRVLSRHVLLQSCISFVHSAPKEWPHNFVRRNQNNDLVHSQHPIDYSPLAVPPRTRDSAPYLQYLCVYFRSVTPSVLISATWSSVGFLLRRQIDGCASSMFRVSSTVALIISIWKHSLCVTLDIFKGSREEAYMAAWRCSISSPQ